MKLKKSLLEKLLNYLNVEKGAKLRIMVSYYHNKKLNLNLLDDYNVELWVDSGAFTAFKKGILLDVADYESYIKEYEPYIKHYMAIDVINNELYTLHNYFWMIERNFKPIPVLHKDDSIELMNYYDNTTNFIALGCREPFKNDMDRHLFIYKIQHLFPDNKYHCLGYLEGGIIDNHNWNSCDSNVWQIQATR